MVKLLQQYRTTFLLLAFILIPILSIDSQTRAPREHAWYDRIALAITSPFQNAIHWTLDTADQFYERYIVLWKLYDKHQGLITENRKLINTIINLRELEQENLRLRNLLNFKESYKAEVVIARMIAKDITPEFRSIRINRGSSSGIAPNMAVVSTEGIVGRVLRVTENSADVITLIDPLSAVDAYILRSRASGIVEGMSDNFCQLKFALRVDDIQPGDILLSSGLGGIFPKGVPVGTVTKVTRKAYGVTQKVEVRPSVDLGQLEEVMVLTKVPSAPVHVEQLPQGAASPDEKEQGVVNSEKKR